MKGADSLATPNVPALAEWGCKVYGGYLGRNLTRGLVQQLQAYGIIVLPIYEETGRPTTYEDGKRQGQRAASLIAAIPELAGYGCSFTDDVSGASYQQVYQWVSGIHDGFGAHIVYYGPSDKGDLLVDAGKAGSVWIEGAWSFSPNYNGRNPQPPQARHACGIQFPYQPNVGGTAVDYNEFISTPWVPGQSQLPKDWLDMATKEEVQQAFKAALMDPEVLEAQSRSQAFWVNGVHDVQQPNNEDGKNVGGASASTIDAKLTQLVNKP